MHRRKYALKSGRGAEPSLHSPRSRLRTFQVPFVSPFYDCSILFQYLRSYSFTRRLFRFNSEGQRLPRVIFHSRTFRSSIGPLSTPCCSTRLSTLLIVEWTVRTNTNRHLAHWCQFFQNLHCNGVVAISQLRCRLVRCSW